MILLAKYGESLTIRFPVVKRAVVDLAASADWTPATGDTKISKDGGNVANTTNNPSAVGGTGSVLWTLTLTGLELQAAEVVVQIVDSATKAIEDQTLIIHTWGHPSAKIPGDLYRGGDQSPYPAEITVTSFASDTTAHAVSMPAAVEANDLLLCLFANDGTATVTTPTGWTQLHTTTDSTDLRLSSYAKKADGTEGGTTVDFVTLSGERAAAQVYRFKRGTWYGDSTSSFAQSIRTGTAATGSSTTPNPPSCAPTWSRLSTLFIAVSANDNGTVTDSAYPSDYVDRTNTVSDANAAGVSLTSAIRSRLTTSEDPGTYTISTEQWVAQTIAIRPAQPVALFGPYVLDALTVTGQLAVQNGIDVSCTTTNRDAFKVVGNGSGSGLVCTGGSTGKGAAISAGGSNVVGLTVTGSGSSAGATITGGSTGTGLSLQGGASGGAGLVIQANNSNFAGATIAGAGTQPGLKITGGATGAALNLVGGATSGEGLLVTTTSGSGFSITGGTNGHGIIATGAGTGSGFQVASGTGAAAIGLNILSNAASGQGHGLKITGATNGSAAFLIGAGAGAGIVSEGGASGHGMNLIGGVTSGFGLTVSKQGGASGISVTDPVLFNSVDNNIIVNVTKIANNATAATNAAAGWAGLIADTGTAQTGTSTTITLRSGASATNDLYAKAAISITSGTGAGQTRQITAYDGSTKVATVDTAWAVTPDNTSVYQVLGRIV